jgi:3-methyladenine DNA glycosylase AlkD
MNRTAPDVAATITLLKRHASKRALDAMARYAIPSDRAFGVPVGTLKRLAKSLGPDHELALGLWKTGWYEARMLATFVDDPARVTPAQMEAWCRDFDNWALCDTAAFALFDRTPHAWGKVARWAASRDEYRKRAAFALLWGLTVHDKQAEDAPFLRGLALIERAATDERRFVKLAVNMALRAVGKRNRALNVAAVKTARRLAGSRQADARWVGSHALRELTGASVTRRLAAKGRPR